MIIIMRKKMKYLWVYNLIELLLFCERSRKYCLCVLIMIVNENIVKYSGFVKIIYMKK